MSKTLDEPWKNWIQENTELGVPPQTIFATLKNNKFDLEDITNTMGWSPEEGSFVVQDSPPPDAPQVIYDKKELKHERRFIYNAEKIKVEDDILDIYKIDNFLTEDECKEIVNITKKNMEKSTVSTPRNTKGYVDNNVRTSSTCALHKSHGGLVTDINTRICDHMGISIKFSEPMQGQHYDETQEFKQHTDSFMPGTHEYTEHCSRQGQRTWTFMVYLNEPKSGGETKFPKVKTLDGKQLSFKPKLGQAITWNNLWVNGDPNQHSTHQGSPVEQGEKTIITKWLRERRLSNITKGPKSYM